MIIAEDEEVGSVIPFLLEDVPSIYRFLTVSVYSLQTDSV